MISEVNLSNFKKIQNVNIRLEPINILVGGNNSGKSSILQGIHFSIMAAVAERENRRKTFPQDRILYCPADNYNALCHGATSYDNSEHGRKGKLTLKYLSQQGESQYTIEIYRGRNIGNIGCVRSGDVDLGMNVTDPRNLFSIYVPGLAGIPVYEEYRSERVVRHGVARGDANLFLRNVLHLIHRKDKIATLNQRLNCIFNDIELAVRFDEQSDVKIEVFATVNGQNTPLELLGTGILQAIQILAYVTLFEPKLLLLDEPDSHLHPNNQSLLVKALQNVTQDINTTIIMSTHSRHLVDALHGEANLIWLRQGAIVNQSTTMPILPILMDIGALDSADLLRSGMLDFILLTEDGDIKLVKKFLESHGCNLSRIQIVPYKGTGKLDASLLLGDYIRDYTGCNNIIIHCDRDFMTNSEADRVKNKIEAKQFIPFITEFSDIEMYFTSANHISHILNVAQSEVDLWINEIALENHNTFVRKFTDKRNDIKLKIYARDEQRSCPHTDDLLSGNIPLPRTQLFGKQLLTLLHKKMQAKFSQNKSLVIDSEYIHSTTFQAILRNVTPVRTSAL
jgi:ABC-type Mn2+/Zn2+ transport system ATPase subunit